MIPALKTPEARKNFAAVGTLILAVGLAILLLSKADSFSYTGNAARSVTAPQFDYRAPLNESDPVRLRIPAIYIDTSFVELGLQKNGEIEVPKSFEKVGWYTYGPTPGELGPAVILGHVDSYEGPAVFLFLGQLHAGDSIYVDREDGSTATFRVTELERYDRDEFPTEKVYGDIDHAGLRLITCSGTFDKTTQEYDRVLVVYAALVEDGAGE